MKPLPLIIAISIGLAVGLATTFELVTVPQAAIATGVAVVGWLVGYAAFARIHARAFNAGSVEAMAMLSRGEYDQAIAQWSRWGKGLTVPGVVIAATWQNIAWVTLRRGELRKALDLYAMLEKQHLRGLRANKLDSICALDRGLCLALLGELEAARHAVAEAGMRSVRAHSSYAAGKAFTESVIACRDGRAAVAVKLFDEHWSEYESSATPDVTRPLQIVRAFASQTTPSITSSYPGEFAFLAVAWPEMAAFLTTHSL